MRKVICLLLLIFVMSVSVAMAAPSENYRGIAVQQFALILQEFDAIAPQRGSSDFVIIKDKGHISPRFLLANAMQSGWNVAFDEQEIENNALLVFSNVEKDSSVIAMATKAENGLLLKWYQKNDTVPHTMTFTSIAAAEEEFQSSFVGAINSSKHIVKWESSASYSSWYSPRHASYAFRLYEKYSGKLRLSEESGFEAIFLSMINHGMAAISSVEQLRSGALINWNNKGICFVTHVDTKNELVYYTWFSNSKENLIEVITFTALKDIMKLAILPEREVPSTILF